MLTLLFFFLSSGSSLLRDFSNILLLNLLSSPAESTEISDFVSLESTSIIAICLSASRLPLLLDKLLELSTSSGESTASSPSLLAVEGFLSFTTSLSCDSFDVEEDLVLSASSFSFRLVSYE